MCERQGIEKKQKATVVPFNQNGDYFFQKGLQAFQNKQLHLAVKRFERAIKLRASEPAFKIQLAAVLTELGQYHRSNDLLYSVLEQCGDTQPVCYFFIANNDVFLGLFFQAEKQIRRYLELEPNGQFVEDANELLELFEDDPIDDEEIQEESLNSHEQAWLLLNEGDVKSAIPFLKKVVDCYPTNWAARNHLAEALFRTGETELAFAQCEDILSQDKGNLLALCNKALFYHALGDTKQMQHYKNSLNNIKPIDTDHKIRLTQVLCTLGDFEEVMKRKRDQSLKKEPALFRCFAVASFHMGDKASALSYSQLANQAGDDREKRLQQAIEHDQIETISYTVFERDYDMSKKVDNSLTTPLT